MLSVVEFNSSYYNLRRVFYQLALKLDLVIKLLDRP